MNSTPISIKYDCLTRSIETVCGVVSDVSREHSYCGSEEGRIGYYKAQWDTGAMSTVISEKVVREMGLEPMFLVPNYTANGLVNSFLFRIDVILPNKVVVPSIQAACCNLGDSGIDILIGMDVITKGDFAITNPRGRSTFSFRIPSVEEIDFTTSRPHDLTTSRLHDFTTSRPKKKIKTNNIN